MEVFLLKSKIHRATVTGGDVNYEGSLTIAADLMEKCGLQEYERILCGNMANGNRWETYVIQGKRGSGEIVMNGATAATPPAIARPAPDTATLTCARRANNPKNRAHDI